MNNEFINCPKCGTRNFIDDKVCGICKSKLIAGSSYKAKSSAKNQNISEFRSFLILGGIIFLIYWVFFADTKNKPGSLKSEACIISRQFVKTELLSPKSSDFDFCDDSKITYLGNNRYQVINNVDASNAFGAILHKTYFVILRYKSGEWEDIQNWALETIQID